MEEIDIWRSANHMVRQYGVNAGYEAGRKAGDLLKAGDKEGFEVWRSIARAIEEMIATTGSRQLT